MRRIPLLTLLLVSAVLGCGGPASPPKDANPKDGKGGVDAPTPASLAKHKYWEVKVTPEQIDGVVTKVVGLTSGDALVIDEKFTVEVEDGAFNKAIRDQVGTQRQIIFAMSRYDARPTREQILKDFARMLDEEEFKAKPKSRLKDQKPPPNQ